LPKTESDVLYNDPDTTAAALPMVWTVLIAAIQASCMFLSHLHDVLCWVTPDKGHILEAKQIMLGCAAT
jgi:hypothetical protein